MTLELSNRWQDIYYKTIKTFADQASKDPSTKVGALIYAPDKSIVSMGFNGFPPDIEDRVEWLNNRDEKLMLTVHAEKNAIKFFSSNNWSLSDCGMVTTLKPCDKCALDIINAGIKRVYFPSVDAELAKRWEESFGKANRLFAYAKVNASVLVNF